MNDKSLPRWDLTPFFTGLDDSRYKESLSRLDGLTNKLGELARGAGGDRKVWLTEVMETYNSTHALFEELYSYVLCLYTTNTADNKAAAELSLLEARNIPVQSFLVSFRNILAEAPEAFLKEAESSEYLSMFLFFLNEQLELQKHQMSIEMEELAADLCISGGDAWSRLQETLTSSETIEWNDGTERKTLTQLRAMAYSPDAEIRKAAWEKELELLERIKVPAAFALNGVKGHSNAVNSRRGYNTSLEKSALQSRISKKTLDSLVSVLKKSLPVFRRYFRLKAGLLGRETLPFFDLFAPVGTESRRWEWEEAKAFIIKQFSGFSSEMGGFAEKAFRENWIDAAPAKGKVGGAYCTGFHESGVCRVLCNYDYSFSGVSTVAHELGHAYHNHVLRDAPEMYRDYPMTLAETASIFAETIVFNGALSSCSDNERLSILETELQEAAQVIVDILSRFLFESEVMDRTKEGPLSAEDFNDIMLRAQKATYGDGMDENFMHQYMWIVKGHYYSPELAFYNFPYAFGKLFGLGIYAEYMKDGAGFASRYNELLYKTGSASAEDVTGSLGFDITGEKFWQQGIDSISRKVDEFEELCRKLV